MDSKTKNKIAVVAGLAVSTLVGLALIPLLKRLMAGSFNYSLSSGMKINYVALYGYGFGWIILTAFAGGFVACWIAAERKIFHSLLTGVFSFLIILFIGKINLQLVITAIAFIPLSVMGGIVRRLTEKLPEDIN